MYVILIFHVDYNILISTNFYMNLSGNASPPVQNVGSKLVVGFLLTLFVENVIVRMQ